MEQENPTPTPSTQSPEWVGFLQKIWSRVFKSPSQRQAENAMRLRQLNLVIEVYPEVPSNYLLRAEYFIKENQIHLAEADFEKALTLATAQLKSEGWGIANQAIIDRAELGLKQVKKLNSAN